MESGITFDPRRIINNKLEIIKLHPDTNEKLEIQLPRWYEIKEEICNICRYIPQMSYLGFDIIITDSGFKIIEINSLSALTFLPYYYPHLKDEYSKTFFTNKFNERPNKFKRVLKELKNEGL